MSDYDVECPYCGEWQEIVHDDGYGYTEDDTHEQECPYCDMTFAYNTHISFDYTANKAPCLNGAEHNMKENFGVPKEYIFLECVDCGYRKTELREKDE